VSDTPGPSEEVDLHARDPEWFREHVQSFQFWFEAVEGYLGGLDHGRPPEIPEAPLSGIERARLVTALCNYCVGETAALEGAGGLIRIAPNRETKIFLSTQTVDEGRHLEVLIHRLRELGVEDPEAEIRARAAPALLAFKDRLLDLVARGDWEAALFAQNVILESMEFAVFQNHARTADPRTHEVLMRIVKDERRHIGFGENELGRRLRAEPSLRTRLHPVRQELDRLVIAAFDEGGAGSGASPREREEITRAYLHAVKRLGFE